MTKCANKAKTESGMELRELNGKKYFKFLNNFPCVFVKILNKTAFKGLKNAIRAVNQQSLPSVSLL